MAQAKLEFPKSKSELRQSQLASVWESLRDAQDKNKHLSEDLITEFQEWCQEEEFNYEALIDDINDDEDESSIAQWLRDRNYHKHNEFMELRQVICPIPSTPTPPPEEEKKSIELDNDPKITPNPEFALDPSNPNFASDLLVALDRHLELKSDPLIIHQLMFNLSKKLSAPVNMKIPSSFTSKPQPLAPVISLPPRVQVDGDDLDAVRNALSRLNEWTNDELDEFVRFCKDQDYGGDEVMEDLETFEQGDSAIVDNVTTLFKWTNSKGRRFTRSLRNILGVDTANDSVSIPPPLIEHPTPQQQTTKPSFSVSKSQPVPQTQMQSQPRKAAKKPNYESSDLATLPKLNEFRIPPHNTIPRPLTLDAFDDIMTQNGIARKIINCFVEWFYEEGLDDLDLFAEFEEEQSTNFKIEYPVIGPHLCAYVDKCLYELTEPVCKGSTFSEQEMAEFVEIMQHECPRMIEHDKNLTKYFMMTRTSDTPEVGSLLIDVVDRLSVDCEDTVDVKAFAERGFFSRLNDKQHKILKSGLRGYHNRVFVKMLTKNIPFLRADKISDYQKYACVLNRFTDEVIARNIMTPPLLIDFFIVAPGIVGGGGGFSATLCMELGDIKQHLDDFKNDSYSTMDGLSADANNFDEKVIEQVVQELCKATEKVMQTVGKKDHQRIVIAVDRRWRVLNDKHCIYNKLRYAHSLGMTKKDIVTPTLYDYEEYKKDIGVIAGHGGEELVVFPKDDDEDDSENDDDDDDDMGKRTSIDFKSLNFVMENQKSNSDTIYVFQPNVPQSNEFSKQYCHETFMYMTKTCILPRTYARVKEYKDGIGRKMPSYNYQPDVAMSGNDHLGGGGRGSWTWNLSVHVEKPYPNDMWYKHKVKWYLWAGGASIRVHHNDINNFWFKFLADAEKDIHKMSNKDLKKYFKLNLEDSDVGFKRWYYALRRSS
eukprot:326917_1